MSLGTPKRRLQIRVLPKFPAQVVAGSGVSIDNTGGVYTISATVGTVGVYVVSSLPSPTAGQLAIVTDATVTTQGSVVIGGGSNIVLVLSTGADWLIA